MIWGTMEFHTMLLNCSSRHVLWYVNLILWHKVDLNYALIYLIPSFNVLSYAMFNSAFPTRLLQKGPKCNR